MLSLVLSVLALAGLENAADVHQLLRSVAAKYDSSIDYDMRIRTKTGQAAFDFKLAASRPHQMMVRQRSRTADRFELLLIATASSSWGYMPLKKRYTANGPERCSERDELARVHDRYYGRFRLLDRIDAMAQITGKGMVQSNLMADESLASG